MLDSVAAAVLEERPPHEDRYAYPASLPREPEAGYYDPRYGYTQSALYEAETYDLPPYEAEDPSYKTRLCVFPGGECPHGAQCKFAHGQVPELGDAFDADATAANAAADTQVVPGTDDPGRPGTDDPDGPAPTPTPAPGGSKKKKKSGDAFPIWAIIIIVVGGVGLMVCLFAVISGFFAGRTKKDATRRASSYKLDAGKRPPFPESDEDEPAAEVLRALEKLDDEEEKGPSRHGVMAAVAAGAAAGAATGAAAESKAPDGDVDCDSDSDLGSRISLHAPV